MTLINVHLCGSWYSDLKNRLLKWCCGINDDFLQFAPVRGGLQVKGRNSHGIEDGEIENFWKRFKSTSYKLSKDDPNNFRV